MSSTLLELTRASHEEIEQLQQLIIKHLQQKEQHPKTSLFHSHQIRDLINYITLTTHKLIEMYQDGDNSRKEEIALLGGGQGANNLFNYFYDRVREIVEYYSRHPNAAAASKGPIDEAAEVMFSGEEANGQYLDLHELYNQYINIVTPKDEMSSMDYSGYLDLLSNPDQVPTHLRTARSYRKYLENLLEYLIHFLARTDPLKDLSVVFSKVEEETRQRYEGKSVIPLGCYTTVEELMDLGSEKLKEALAALGLKTGGTVTRQAERLIATKHTPLEQLHGKYFSKQTQARTLEINVKRVCELLSETITRTKEHVERKRILTYNEIEAERLQHDEEGGADGNDTYEEEESCSRPLKDHNGQPIEMWKYKLHGLKQGFNCEICGNHLLGA